MNGSISSTFVLELYAKCLQGEHGSLKKYSAPGSDGPLLGSPSIDTEPPWDSSLAFLEAAS